jgi:hypothetical protein
MELKFVILFSMIAFVLGLNRFYVWADKKRRLELQNKIVPSDKEIISMLDDPLTGEKVSLSETASNSDEEVFYDESRKTSETVLNKYYTQDGDLEKEFILIKNYLLDEGFAYNKFSENEVNALEETKILSGYLDWSYSDSYHKSNLSFFVASVVIKSNHSRYSSREESTDLFFWIKDFNFIGHYCFYKKGIVEHVIDIFDSDEDRIKRYQTVVVKKSAMDKEMLLFLKTLDYQGDLEIEAHNSDVFIKVNNLATKDNLVAVYQSIKKSLAAIS